MTFMEVYHRHARMVYNLCLNYLHGREDAQEATQDVFLKVHKRLTGFKGDASVSTWIYRITINTCLDRLKARKRTVVIVTHRVTTLAVADSVLVLHEGTVKAHGPREQIMAAMRSGNAANAPQAPNAANTPPAGGRAQGAARPVAPAASGLPTTPLLGV